MAEKCDHIAWLISHVVRLSLFFGQSTFCGNVEYRKHISAKEDRNLDICQTDNSLFWPSYVEYPKNRNRWSSDQSFFCITPKSDDRAGPVNVCYAFFACVAFHQCIFFSAPTIQFNGKVTGSNVVILYSIVLFFFFLFCDRVQNIFLTFSKEGYSMISTKLPFCSQSLFSFTIFVPWKASMPEWEVKLTSRPLASSALPL